MKKILGIIIGLLFACNVFATSITFQKIVDTNTPIPSGSGNFLFLSGPYIHHGKIVFRGYGANGQRGVYTNLHGSLHVVADTSTAIPNGHGTFNGFGIPAAPSHNMFQYLAYNSPSLDNSSIAFLGTGSNGQAGIYLYHKGHLSVIANNTKGFSQFDGPYVNHGMVMFRAFNKHNEEGLYLFNKKLSLLYNTKTQIPNGTGNFIKLWNPSFNNGETAFRGNGINNQEGVYVNISGKLKMVANLKSMIPNGEGKFIGFGGPSIQGSALVFRGEGQYGHGIYLFAKNKLTKVADLKTPIPNGKGLFTGLYNPTYDHSNTSFIGKGKNHQVGIYVMYHHKLIKVVTNRDALEGKAIDKLDMGAVSLSKNKIAFHVIFKDKSNGIYLATLR